MSYKLLLLVSGIFILIVELINSAIENVVDLVTLEIKPLAKSAKDLGSSAVFVSVFLHFSIWFFVLYDLIVG